MLGRSDPVANGKKPIRTASAGRWRNMVSGCSCWELLSRASLATVHRNPQGLVLSGLAEGTGVAREVSPRDGVGGGCAGGNSSLSPA